MQTFFTSEVLERRLIYRCFYIRYLASLKNMPGNIRQCRQIDKIGRDMLQFLENAGKILKHFKLRLILQPVYLFLLMLTDIIWERKKYR